MLEQFLDFILALLIIIVAAKVGGYVSFRLGQPSVLGELLVGVILGPTVFDMVHSWSVLADTADLDEFIRLMAEIGVILLMMLAGLELHLDELVSSGKVSAFSGILGVFFPFGLGYATALLFDAPPREALLMGLTLSATSVSISAQTLMELNVLRSKVGLGMLGAAVFDDILVILLLSLSFLLVGGATGGALTILITVGRMVLYIVLAVIAGLYVLPWMIRRAEQMPVSQGLLSFVIVAVLFYAWSAEMIGGMATITGAFMIGLFLGRTPFRERIESGIAAMAYAFFVPIFFVDIGLEVNMRSIGSGQGLVFALAITVVAILSKIVGSGLGARLAGFSWRPALQLGIGMVSRGEVGLIVASVALANGLLSAENFSIVVFMVIVATLVTPPMLRASFAAEVAHEGGAA
ncbi:MAG: cation:proton antiporter [Anaerolineae bacterium]|nr:cation:proton antiporter [Anaerolineae bacterium]